MHTDLSKNSGKNTSKKQKTITSGLNVTDATEIDISPLIAENVANWSNESLLDVYSYSFLDEEMRTIVVNEMEYRGIDY